MTATARHPWNTSFEWRRTGTVPRRLTTDQVDSFHRDGWLIVDDLVDPATVAELTDDPARQDVVLRDGVAIGVDG